MQKISRPHWDSDPGLKLFAFLPQARVLSKLYYGGLNTLDVPSDINN